MLLISQKYSYVGMLSCIFFVVSGWAVALQAGTAKVEFSPSLGAPLAGYAFRANHGAVDRHDPLYVRSLYLEDADTRAVLVSVDLHSISPELRERVVEQAPSGISADKTCSISRSS